MAFFIFKFSTNQLTVAVKSIWSSCSWHLLFRRNFPQKMSTRSWQLWRNYHSFGGILRMITIPGILTPEDLNRWKLAFVQNFRMQTPLK
jgi:hypothetical protein